MLKSFARFFCCGEKKITPINQSTIKKSASGRLQKIKAIYLWKHQQ